MRVGALRSAFIARAEGLGQDLVFFAPDREMLAALIFPLPRALPGILHCAAPLANSTAA